MVVPDQHSIARAMGALTAYPHLWAEAAPEVHRQAQRVAACAQHTVEQPGIRHALADIFAAHDGGFVALEGSTGSGVTTALVALAAHEPYPLWLCDDAPAYGSAILYAQIVALHRSGLPLVDPMVATHAQACERLLFEIAERFDANHPLVLLVDAPALTTQPLVPFAPILPIELPPHIFVVWGSEPDVPIPVPPIARVHLAHSLGDALAAPQAHILRALECPAVWHPVLIDAAQGNTLYLRHAATLLHYGAVDVRALPVGLAQLHALWWRQLDINEQKVAALLAAAGEPLPIALCTELLDETQPIFTAWARLGLVEQRRSSETTPTIAWSHSSLRQTVARQAPELLLWAHDEVTSIAFDRHLEQLSPRDDDDTGYLVRQFARHAAFASASTQHQAFEEIQQREWVRTHMRRGTTAVAATEQAWILWRGADDPSRLIQPALLAGTLTDRTRTLAPDNVTAAFDTAFEQFGREASLKRVLGLVDQLPDGSAKAQVLRQLGEACYSKRMRTSAMRLLAQALDLEEQPIARSWHEQRNHLFAVFVTAALDSHAVATAVAISSQIEHAERRAAAETQVVHWLLNHGDHEWAQQITLQITHENLGAWARAEVAVALARAGKPAAAVMLQALTPETVFAWAQVELACDDARHNEAAAQARIQRLASASQRDRGLGRLAHALALADKDGDALAAAEQIVDVEVRVAALLDLRSTLNGLVAMLALERATADIGAVTSDTRIPLLVLLAAAFAALGHRDHALAITQRLAEGDERDRALSRVAVAFARRGDYVQAQTMVGELTDIDERDWALDEIARLLGQAAQWPQAYALVVTIAAADQRDHTLADIAIAQARAGDACVALAQACAVAGDNERVRALNVIGPLLVTQGYATEAVAQATAVHLPTVDARSRYLSFVASAIALQGDIDAAEAVIGLVQRPFEQARAHIALAQIVAPVDQNYARLLVAKALQRATLGREETLRLLAQAARVLAQLGGAESLHDRALTASNIDQWTSQ